MLPVSRDLLLTELTSARDYLVKWISIIEEGIPGVDIPVSSGNSEDRLDEFIRELCGELRVISGKCDTLAEVVADYQGG